MAMSFFDQIGKRISDAGQNVAQQTKNFADVTQLNATIAEKERAVSQLYLSIGQAYYENHKDDASAEELQTIEQIKALHGEIAQCREKINQIKGVIPCANCGADVPAHAAFCTACGTKVERAPAAQPTGDVKLCPTCNAAVPVGNLFCSQCGTKMPSEENT